MPKNTCSHSKNCVWRAAAGLNQLGSKLRPHHLCVALTDDGEPCATRAVAALGRDEDTFGMFYGLPLCDIHARGVVSGVSGHLEAVEKSKPKRGRPKKAQGAKEQWIEKNDHVYFARRGEDVKIGHSIQPSKRLRGLSTQGGFEFDEVVLVLGGRALEQKYHRRFAEHRGTGEWFTMCDAIRQEMDQLKTQDLAA